MNNLIGRKQEQQELKDLYESGPFLPCICSDIQTLAKARVRSTANWENTNVYVNENVVYSAIQRYTIVYQFVRNRLVADFFVFIFAAGN